MEPITIGAGLETFLALAVFIQFVVERIKVPIPEQKRGWAVPLVALFIAILLAFSCKIGFLNSVGIPVQPVSLDYIFTAVVMAAGSTIANDLVKLFRGIKETVQTHVP